jgi:hypothetical protein
MPTYLVLTPDGKLLLNPENDGLAVGVPLPGFGAGSWSEYMNCCGGKCNCMCNTLPSSWTLEFHDCTHEQTCLNGLTFTVPRNAPLTAPTGYPVGHECAGYVLGSPSLASGATAYVKWVGVYLTASFGQYGVSVGMKSSLTYGGIPSWGSGDYSVGGVFPIDEDRADRGRLDGGAFGSYGGRWDCLGNGGTIAQSGSLMYFAFDYHHWGIQVDVTPNP